MFYQQKLVTVRRYPYRGAALGINQRLLVAAGTDPHLRCQSLAVRGGGMRSLMVRKCAPNARSRSSSRRRPSLHALGPDSRQSACVSDLRTPRDPDARPAYASLLIMGGGAAASAAAVVAGRTSKPATGIGLRDGDVASAACPCTSAALEVQEVRGRSCGAAAEGDRRWLRR